MYTATALLDIHTRTHRSFAGLLDHCAGFSAGQLAQSLDGFGYGTIALQLHHMAGAERYWLGVLQGQMLIDEHEQDHASIDALRAYRSGIADTTAAYLRDTSDATLNERATFQTWKQPAALVPAQVILRTQSHVFQHQGQIAAMARLLGRPIPTGLDFPLR